jgi:hypothetical protein
MVMKLKLMIAAAMLAGVAGPANANGLGTQKGGSCYAIPKNTAFYSSFHTFFWYACWAPGRQ